ncbi:heme-binding domain-containing protein [Mariniflexile gromovii]|uniref:Heme-binding domain-containing protein n=1 Tax=Mariniflexile gromovii TaxID=362523 RepID=A0ABS4BNT7_9FLAO|nr:heme-binding domain-containing protein [Mariniflexile gromovii]MBP0902221.1 heme-binding domain-containing protein [Mariniflexile gromovii]
MKKRTIKIVLIALTGIIILFLILQFADKPLENRPVISEVNINPEINAVFQRACYNCHSNEVSLKWFDKVVPISWIVKRDVSYAREVMNFSEWDSTPAAENGKLWAILNMVKSYKMPLENYLTVHPEANVTDQEIALIEGYVRALPDENFAKDTLRKKISDDEFKLWRNIEHHMDSVPLSPNGIKYSDDFKNWKVLSLNTLYGETMRVTYGNDILVKAIESEQFNSIPDGAIAVKAVWEQTQNKYGEITPGKFINVQFMVKDAKKHKDTEGWGFAKFSTQNLIPYGKTPDFAVNACISCHRLKAKETGYLFNVPDKITFKK